MPPPPYPSKKKTLMTKSQTPHTLQFNCPFSWYIDKHLEEMYSNDLAWPEKKRMIMLTVNVVWGMIVMLYTILIATGGFYILSSASQFARVSKYDRLQQKFTSLKNRVSQNEFDCDHYKLFYKEQKKLSDSFHSKYDTFKDELITVDSWPKHQPQNPPDPIDTVDGVNDVPIGLDDIGKNCELTLSNKKNSFLWGLCKTKDGRKSLSFLLLTRKEDSSDCRQKIWSIAHKGEFDFNGKMLCKINYGWGSRGLLPCVDLNDCIKSQNGELVWK